MIADLDIYERVGRGVAHDEYVPYSVRDGKLYCDEEESDIRNGKIRVEFIKGYRDNPKINALYVVRGRLEDVPKLPPLPPDPDPDDSREEPDEKVSKARRPSGPKQPDPYLMDDSSVMLPVFIAIGAFIPFLFCLCKL